MALIMNMVDDATGLHLSEAYIKIVSVSALSSAFFALGGEDSRADASSKVSIRIRYFANQTARESGLAYLREKVCDFESGSDLIISSADADAAISSAYEILKGDAAFQAAEDV